MFTLGLWENGLGVVIFGALQYLASIWISERLKTSLQKEHSKFLENLKWELKVREQSVRVAEYLALARNIKENSPDSDYRKANQLSWELAMWLPEDIYKEMVNAIVKPSDSITSANIRSFSTDDIKKFGRPPVGAKAFFIGDQLGGSGWEVELPDGSKEKYYVELPSSIGAVTQHFSNLPEAMSPELKGATVEELAKRYIERLAVLVTAARTHFLGPPTPRIVKHIPPYLRRVK